MRHDGPSFGVRGARSCHIPGAVELGGALNEVREAALPGKGRRKAKGRLAAPLVQFDDL
jgi:hypothetical protein